MFATELSQPYARFRTDSPAAAPAATIHTCAEPRSMWTRAGAALVQLGLVSLLGSLLFGPPASAQDRDNKGQEFMLGFMQNFPDPTLAEAIVLFITGDVATTGQVEIPGLSFSQAFSVTPGTITQVTLPAAVRMTGSDVTAMLGVLVTAADEVVVYGLNQKRATTDAFLGLPTDILGTQYIILSWPTSFSGGNESEFVIAAVDDGTLVTITPSVDTGTRMAGMPYTIALDRFDTYQLKVSTVGGDLTGTTISATNPIAVFAGVQCANIPNSGTGFCDHIVEQLPSTSTWGTSFVTVPLATRQAGDVFRILASDNATEVRIDGLVEALLGAGEFFQTDIPSDTFSTVETSGPALVMQYSKGTTADGVTSDPFMLMIPPTEQFLPSYTLSTPAATPVAFTNFINLAVPTADVLACTLDGSPITATFTPIGTSIFSGAQIPVEIGSHTLACPTAFGAYAYGFAEADSYGYPGGLALEVIAVDCATPVFDPPTPIEDIPLQVVDNTPITFTIAASDPDVDQIVTLTVEGLPAGAIMTPALPLAGNPVSSTFSWTPTTEDLGLHEVIFTATDDCSADIQLEATRPVIVAVVEELVPKINWITSPPPEATGGALFTVEWLVANFTGTITQNQAHFGITSVLGSSDVKPGTLGAHTHTFTAPNIGVFDSPTTFKYIVRAFDDDLQILSPLRETEVTAGPTAPQVTWITPPPLAVQSGGAFTVEWQVANYQAPVSTNAVVWGITRVLDQTPNQPGSNGVFTATVPVPVVAGEGTLFYTAVAANPIEFAFAPITPVRISLTPPVPAASLFPTLAGSSWLYGTAQDTEVTVTVAAGQVDIGGVSTVVLEGTDGSGLFVTNDAAGLAVHREGWAVPETQITYNPPYAILPAQAFLGLSVPSSGLAEVVQPGQPVEVRAYEASFTFEGIETLTVKAGTFETARVRGTINFGGAGSRSLTLWLAPGVGRVQIADTVGGARELIDTNLP